MSDSIFKENNLRKTLVKEYQFEYEKKKQKIELEQKQAEEINRQERERERERVIRNAYLIISIISIIFIIVLLISLIRNKKINNLLSQQKKEIEEKNNELFIQGQDILEKAEELRTMNQDLQDKNEYITGSIRYAKTIQQAIMSTNENFSEVFETFIIFRPKDVVSGDFYWFSKTKNKTLKDKTFPYILAVSDCTGHGVPGAFMSIIGNNLLNEIVNENRIYSPKNILEELDIKLKFVLHYDKRHNMNGMDISLCNFEFKENFCKMTFSGAKRYILVFRKSNNEFITLKGDVKSIGGNYFGNKKSFTNKEMNLKKGDAVYLFSDGLFDQNNYERKSLGKTKVLSTLKTITEYSMKEQKHVLEFELDKWQGDEFQRDDITFIGIRIP